MKYAIAFALALLPGLAVAQTHQTYAVLQQRAIKALSEQQVADLRAGRGMGLALPAELNGYPGPMHVLEHADALSLSDAQRQRTRAMIDEMRAEAVPVGERLIAQEAELERLFAGRQITAEKLRDVTEQIGSTQARLREAHLKYHLAMMTVLTSAQVDHYRNLRGYSSSPMPQHQQHRRH